MSKYETIGAFLFRGMRGCGSHDCVIEKPKGMGTNGGCLCREDRQKARVVWERLSLIAGQRGVS